MPKLPRIGGSEAVRAFRKAGFHTDRYAGSHEILKKPGHPFHLSVPVHKGKNVATGTLRALIADAGLTVEEFVELLRS